MREVTGHCPSCLAAGPVGQPCAERSCQRRGYHCIPEESFAKVRELPPARIDPRVGQCIGEYLLVDVLGAGGFGKVYLALQLPIAPDPYLQVRGGGAFILVDEASNATVAAGLVLEPEVF